MQKQSRTFELWGLNKNNNSTENEDQFDNTKSFYSKLYRNPYVNTKKL